MESLAQDVRFAARSLLADWRVSLTALSCLAFAIGANTTIFSVVNAVLLRPLPAADPERTVAVHASRLSGESTGLSFPDYRDLQRQSTAFAEIGACKEYSVTVTGAGEPQRLSGQGVTANLFPILGAQPLLGRSFRAEDDRPGAPGAVLISHVLWSSHFGGDEAVLGRSILVNGKPHTVVGVMPPRFRFPEREDAWVPLVPLVHEDPRSYRDLHVFARLAPGADLGRAREEAAVVAGRLSAEFPDSNAGWSLSLVPLREELTGAQLRLTVLALMGAVVFVLLIACANLANLLFARATARRREIAVRVAFGAGRGRIVRQLMTESLLLALAGGAAGTLFALWGIRLIESGIPSQMGFPYWVHFSIDGAVLLFTLCVALAAGMLFGLAPALQVVKQDTHAVLKEGGRGGTGGAGGGRVRAALVVAEVAVSLVLLVGTSLFVRSFLELQRASGGFDTAEILTLRIYLPGDAYSEDEAKARRVEDVVRRLESLPGIQAVGASNTIPLSGGGSRRSLLIEGRSYAPGDEPNVFYTGVTAHFFDALGVGLVAGRELTDREALTRSGAALVNRRFAELFWPEGSALGKRFRDKNDPEGEWLTIAGVVPNIKNDDIDRDVPPSAYVPYPYQASRSTGLLVRARGDEGHLTAAVREQVRAADPDVPVFEVAAMETVRRQGFWEHRFFSGLFLVFSAVALLLAVVGVYGVLAYSVARRRREIGVRVALGAARANILRTVVGQGLALVLAGVALGLVGAFAVGRSIAGLLYNVGAADPLSFAGIPLLLIGIALLACSLPARQALKVDPQEALRHE